VKKVEENILFTNIELNQLKKKNKMMARCCNRFLRIYTVRCNKLKLVPVEYPQLVFLILVKNLVK
jgi:hypothetical protein